MKKNNMFRIASVLLVAVLLSTCAISGAFAKYIKEGPSVQDTARVALFGVDVVASGADMFGTDYAKDPTNTIYTVTGVAEDDAAATTVHATVPVVAPGTKGNLAAVSISGTPEVDVAVTYVLTLDLGGKWLVEGAYYCPIEITVGSQTYKGTDYTSEAEFKADVEGAASSLAKTYDAGTNLSTVTATDLAISWAWAFEDNDDAKDTLLAGVDAADAATIDFTVKATVTQID